MDGQETSHVERRRIEEVAIGGRFDTAGFLYSPYRAEFDNTTRTLQLTDNALRDIVRDDLLCRAIVWLLGYDARFSIDDQIHNEPIRAQANCSHWETAWCLHHFLNVRPILAARHPSVVREIDRRLKSDDREVNPLVWLLSEATDQDGNQVCWYGKEYDTAVVALSLLRAKAEHNLPLPGRAQSDLERVLSGSVRWLFNNLEDSLETGRVDEEAIEVLEPLVCVNSSFSHLVSSIWPIDHALKADEFYTVLDKWLSYLEAPFATNPDNLPPQYGFGANEAYCLCRLVLTCPNADPEDRTRLERFAERGQNLLLHYISFLEEWLARDQWGGNLNRVWRLGTYVEACESVSLSLQHSRATSPAPNPASSEVVLKVLSMVKNEFFSNGSIYHSVYPTVYFVRSLIAIWEWEESSKTIARLYHDLLDKYVIGVSLERKENFELRKLLVESERKLADERERFAEQVIKERKKRYALLGIVWVSIVAAVLVYAAYNLSLSDLIQFAGVAAAVLTIILITLEVLFLRDK